MEAYELNVSRLAMNDDEFYEFCRENSTLKLEREANGIVRIMPNTGGKTGKMNAEIMFQLVGWNKRQQLGEIFDSSTAFILPTRAVRSADAAFVTNERWNGLTEEQQEKFPPLCPDFVIELMSPSDMLASVRKKVQTEWMDNGCRLAWLIDPKTETVYIYRAEGSIHILRSFDETLSGEDVLPGFVLDLKVLR